MYLVGQGPTLPIVTKCRMGPCPTNKAEDANII
jgi:hypothetical protein